MDETNDEAIKEKKDDKELKKMWLQYKSTDDPGLRDEIIEHYLHLVKYVVNRLIISFPAHIKSQDLYSTGIIGLIRAVEKYDPEYKNKFETYAVLLIKGAIIDEMRSQDWVPRSVHQKSNMVSRAMGYLQQKLGREPTVNELSKYLDISKEELDTLLAKIKPIVMLSLNAEKHEESDSIPLIERIPDNNVQSSYDIADRNEFRKQLEKSVLDLPEQERIVLVLYYYEGLMLKEIGSVMGVSESRVSQIHAKALARLKKRLTQFGMEYSNMF
jgi:RNA polymerase sigma factor FliA